MGPYAVHCKLIGTSYKELNPCLRFSLTHFQASVLDWPNMMLETRVNGQVRQSANTSQLIFDIPTLIATCSMGIALQPGDVIATGTPAGVCLSLGEFLKHRDVIDVSISGLGNVIEHCWRS